MWKTILASTIAFTLIGSATGSAQQNEPQSDRGQGWRPNAADVAAFGDARIAALHAGLKLSADQEKNWPPVESALRDLAQQRATRFAARANLPQDPVERLAAHADAMQQRALILKKLADAAGPLYKSLDESQKHRFVLLSRFARHQFDHMGSHMGRHRSGEWSDHRQGRLDNGKMNPQNHMQ